MGVICLIGITKYDFKVIYHDYLLIIFLALFASVFYILSDTVERISVKKFPMSEKEIRFFFTQYPPRFRADLWRLDAAMVIVLLIPLFAK